MTVQRISELRDRLASDLDEVAEALRRIKPAHGTLFAIADLDRLIGCARVARKTAERLAEVERDASEAELNV
jgi:hypothetical protein